MTIPDLVKLLASIKWARERWQFVCVKLVLQHFRHLVTKSIFRHLQLLHMTYTLSYQYAGQQTGNWKSTRLLSATITHAQTYTHTHLMVFFQVNLGGTIKLWGVIHKFLWLEAVLTPTSVTIHLTSCILLTTSLMPTPIINNKCKKVQFICIVNGNM